MLLQEKEAHELKPVSFGNVSHGGFESVFLYRTWLLMSHSVVAGKSILKHLLGVGLTFTLNVFLDPVKQVTSTC
jgi:hypothetical protein